jgi:hypothetical protein
MILAIQNLYFEVVGEANEATSKNVFGNLETRVLPYARLGDFTLHVSICADAIRQFVQGNKIATRETGLDGAWGALRF